MHFSHQQVWIDNQGAYNKNSAPVTGTYVFIWSIVNKERNYQETQLVIGGKKVGKAISDAYGYLDHNTVLCK